MKIIGTIKSSLIILMFILFDNANVSACMCGKTSVCDAYEQASAIIIGKVKKVEIPRLDGNGFYKDRQTVLVQVRKSFKGIKQTEIKLSQEHTTCDWWFKDEDIDKTYLFYLSKFKDNELYSVISCGRSEKLNKANDDLTWLYGLPKSLGRTRISGVSKLDTNDFPSLSKINLKVVGENKKYEIETDKNGFYQIWDVPIGEYSIIPQIPNNLTLAWTSSVPDNWIYFWDKERQDQDALKVTIEKKGCGGIDFTFKRKNNEN